MADSRFNRLREELLDAGVAGYNVRRAVMEIESHYQQLIEDDCARGTGADDARMEANVLIGSNEKIKK